ncbi:MAG: beta-lactamase family protein, partial [Planctomycetales bacterium]|nr:beta-lactamase family protein [Planctomycetales bacterium]
MQQHIRTLILGTSICGALAVPATVSADVVYDDPDGRFSMTFLGDWATDAEDARWLAYGDMPLAMTVLTLETQDVAAAVEAGLRELGVDPATLTETTRTNWNRWLLLGFDHGEDQGLTVLAQPRDGSTVVIVGRGQRDLTNNPPQNIIATLETVRFAGAAQLPQSIPDFEAYVAEAMSGGPPGVSIAIANPGEIVYAKGFGLADGPDQTPATPGTVYQWGSVTKTVTATAIMQLVEQG